MNKKLINIFIGIVLFYALGTAIGSLIGLMIK